MRSILFRFLRALPWLLALVAMVLLGTFPEPAALASRTGCPSGMRSVEGAYCIDAYEASLVEILADGSVRPHPHVEAVAEKNVRAVSRRGRFPQGYISRNEAANACSAAGKRLCEDLEWVKACKGHAATRYPYGDARSEGTCNDTAAISPLNYYYFGVNASGINPYGWEAMNDPRLNRLAGGLMRAGEKSQCRSDYGAYDMVGNLHEWTAAAKGTFRGGYYLDTKVNGEGCDYQTLAHNATYHDYSTGFRCCADID